MKRRPTPQPRSSKPRTPVSSAFLDSIEAAVQKEMRRWNVSRSFVIATAVAFALRVEDQPSYVRGYHRVKVDRRRLRLQLVS